MSDKAPNPSDHLVKVATASNPAQAHIWQEALEKAGISCKAVGDYLGAGIGNVPGAQAELWVHQDQAEEAERLLEEIRENHDEA